MNTHFMKIDMNTLATNTVTELPYVLLGDFMDKYPPNDRFKDVLKKISAVSLDYHLILVPLDMIALTMGAKVAWESTALVNWSNVKIRKRLFSLVLKSSQRASQLLKDEEAAEIISQLIHHSVDFSGDLEAIQLSVADKIIVNNRTPYRAQAWLSILECTSLALARDNWAEIAIAATSASAEARSCEASKIMREDFEERFSSEIKEGLLSPEIIETAEDKIALFGSFNAQKERISQTLDFVRLFSSKNGEGD